MTPHRPKKVLLVCSPGGHLLQMLALRPCWFDLQRVWVTVPGVDVDYLLRDEPCVVMGYGPAVGNRGAGAFLRNLRLALRLLRTHRPDAILSTGAGLAVPFFLVGRLFGCRLVFVESLSRVRGLSLSGRAVYRLAHDLFVQWPEAARGRARFVGSVL